MNKSICRYNVSMLSLLECVNAEPIGAAFILDDDDKFCGIITDGDVRRMLLGGRPLESTLSKSDLNPDYVFAYQEETIEEVLKKTNTKVRIVPILTRDHRLVDYFRYEHQVKMLPVAEPELSGNEFRYLTDAFLSSWISSSGAYLDRWEESFSRYCGASYGVAVSNGTVALHLALVAMDIGPGSEVIIPNLTFAATANAVIHAGATPVIVDIDEKSWCIDPDEIEKAITPQTKAIIPVHVYGQPCDMVRIMEIANKHGLKVLEDAAEAHGATINGKKVGSFGHASAFSFFGNKIITTGEGGMVLTSDPVLAEKLKVLRDHGMSRSKKYWHDVVGYNYRTTNIQAAVGCAQLERIESILAKRHKIEENYRKWLQHLDIFDWQQEVEGNQKVTWLVSVLCKGIDRDLLFDHLRKNGIDVRPFFYPLTDMPLYAKYHFSGAKARIISQKGLNLPTINNIDFNKVSNALETISVFKA